MGKARADHTGPIGTDAHALWPVDALEYFFRYYIRRRAFGADAAFMYDGRLIAEPEYVVGIVATNENGHSLCGHLP